jgi:phosphate transport system permease protein
VELIADDDIDMLVKGHIDRDAPAEDRRVNDRMIAWVDRLDEQGLVKSKFNTGFFTNGDSREPELAGIGGAVAGSFYTLLVTLSLSFPIGVAAAIYLEEFAPKNRWTDLIEVNINNLAAVPSIVFGLLGLAMFINLFGLPRSAPLVGGLVLTLMTLPTIIIASRAALKSVPPSIREAALGVGASRMQTMFHHVLPLAMPGMLTGTIIGMAQALGETAPLLMIGMVAFIVDIPGGPLDPATVLPVQVYLWADSPERAFVERTSAAIIVLLAFLIAMNTFAVIMRRRFERRW